MVKEIAHSLREYKRVSIATPVLVTFEVLLECLIPYVIAILVDEIQGGCTLETILIYGAILIVMAAASLVFGVCSGAACASASSGLAKNLRKDMFYKIQSYSFQNIDKFNVSSLITRMTTDVTNVQTAYMLLIRLVVRSPLMLIFSFVMAFVMGGNLAWVFVAVVPLLAVGLTIIVVKTIPLFHRAFRKYDKLNNSVQENVKAAREVKSYVREDYEQKKFGAASHDLRMDFQKAERILAFNSPIMQFCLYVVMCVVLTYGSYLVITGVGNESSIGIGELSSILTYGFMMLNSLMMLSMAFTMIAMASESGRRIVEVLKEESSLQNPAQPVYEVKDGSVDFDDVSFKYSAAAERNALSDINLHIKSGETIGIIGGTGSSKSTLVQLISRLYENAQPAEADAQAPAEAPAAEESAPAQEQPAQPARVRPAGNVEFSDLQEQAEDDGLKITTSDGTRGRTAVRAVGSTFDKGKVLFLTAVYVFIVALAESILNICLMGVLGSGAAYVTLPFVLTFVFLGIFLFLYLRGYGKNSRRSQAKSYVSASLILYANLVLIICLIAFLVIYLGDESVHFVHVLRYAIFPSIFAFNVPLFAILYNYNCKKE